MSGELLYCLTLLVAMASMYGEVLTGVCKIFDSISVAALSTSRSDGRGYIDITAGYTVFKVFFRVHMCMSAIAYE